MSLATAVDSVEALPIRGRGVREKVAAALSAHGRLGGQIQALGPDDWRVMVHRDGGQEVGVTALLQGRWCQVVWRGPLVAPEFDALALAQLQGQAKHSGRQLIVIAGDSTTTEAGTGLGFSKCWLGSECFVDLTQWSLAGGRRKKLRWARNHAAKTSTWREAHPQHVWQDLVQMLQVERRWKAERKARETDSFLRTSLLENADRRRYFVCEAATGSDALAANGGASATEITAYVVTSPLNHESCYLQDFVRNPAAPRGSLEGAVVMALDTLKAEGVREASNGVLPMWSPKGETSHEEPGPVATSLVNYFDSRYHFSGLNQFRRKLEPDRVEPVHALIWPPRLGPRAALSLARVLSRAPNRKEARGSVSGKPAIPQQSNRRGSATF